MRTTKALWDNSPPNLPKSDVLFQNLRKALVQERKIAATDVLTLADQNKVMGIYVEFCNAAVL